MGGQIVQPEMPGLFANLSLRGIAMLVQRLEITENTGDFFPSDTQFLSFHESPPQECPGWDGL